MKGDFNMEFINNIGRALENIKEKSPLVHHITNYVTVNDCANIVLAIGGSPVMADDKAEVEEMVSFASALVINVGTLNERTIESMIKAGKKANELNVPVILDPVGVGATTLRTNTVKALLQRVKFAVVRGNMSEIKITAGVEAEIKGVDSTASEEGALEIAKGLAKRLNTVVAITGARDVITDGTRYCYVDNGHKILSMVTGTGCMTTSLIGAYAGANEDYFLAAVAGIVSMGIAGEKAQESLSDSDGIGTFKVRLMDNIYKLSNSVIVKRGKVIYE
jgi:hydroxyethylthiazole kinase